MMYFPLRLFAPSRLIILSLALLAVSGSRAESPATQPTVLRFVEDDAGHCALESAVLSYRRGEVSVDLYAAVHVAEAAYYQSLNHAFAGYDAVLYEMVKPRGMVPAKPDPSRPATTNGITAIHRIMQRATQLAFQMDQIDYTPANFVHADLDWETFAEAMTANNELSGILLRSYAAAAAGEQTTAVRPEVLMGQFMLALSDPKQARELKYMLAREFANLEKMTESLNGPDGGVLLGKRNRAAIEVLGDTIARGKKHVAIFYGAAHLPDLGKRLEALGFEYQQTKWLTAWDIPADEPH